jgi:hypothetical protein
LPVSLHVVSVAKRCKAAPISVNPPFVSLYCTRSLKSVHDMSSSFAPNHIGMPLLSPKLKLDFLRRQILMSRNISGGPPISVFMGGLNYQIGHHLFRLHGATQLVKRSRSSPPTAPPKVSPSPAPRSGSPTASSSATSTPSDYAARAPFPVPPDRSTPRPLTLRIQLPALGARHSSSSPRCRRTHRISGAMPASRQREPDGEGERIRDAEQTTTCAGDDQCSAVPTLPSFVSAVNRFSFDSCRCLNL